MRPVEEVEEDRVHEPEVVRDTALVRSPSVPTTVDELAALQDEGEEIIEARVVILQTLRAASIRATSPQDWLLFKKDDSVTAYLEDAGCKRVAPLWGIEITPTSGFTKTVDDRTGEYAYEITGNGSSAITKATVHAVTGLRLSTDDFVRDVRSSIQKEMRVKQAARANMDGNIIRALTGLKKVPLEAIEDAWKGTGKDTSRCNLGRGYGSKHERAGVSTTKEGQPDIKPPICDSCGGNLRYVPGGTNNDGSKWKPYWKCPQYKWDSEKRQSNGHSKVDAAQWESTMAAAAKAEQKPGDREPGGDDK